MKKAVHFGAGNIGRGFIGEVLFENQFQIIFIDVNQSVINQINHDHEYDVQIIGNESHNIHITDIKGINNKKDPEKVVDAIAEADLVTTAIGPKILELIAPLISEGIYKRKQVGNDEPLDIIACENMIGGSQKLKQYVESNVSDDIKEYMDDYIGFPNAAVDRIVPIQNHKNQLFVETEDFKEWIVDQSQMKNPNLKLKGVEYVDDLEPYIERKLFSVNTGHATVAYAGAYFGYHTIIEAMGDKTIYHLLENVLNETGKLLINKWHFNESIHHQYQQKIIERFSNKAISDDISRVARTPIRKLGYNERFIRPIRELEERSLPDKSLLQAVGMVYKYDNKNDEESVELQEMEHEMPIEQVIKQTTQVTQPTIIKEILDSVESLA